MEQNKFPWISFLIIAFIMILCINLAFGFFFDKADPENATQQKIDAVYKKQDSAVSSTVAASKSNVTKSNNLKKSLPLEIPVITDTTDAYMREYISNYTPEFLTAPKP